MIQVLIDQCPSRLLLRWPSDMELLYRSIFRLLFDVPAFDNIYIPLADLNF